jgi:hypothetical protein
MRGTFEHQGNSGGRLDAEISADDLAHFAAEVERLEAAGLLAGGGGNDYCITCTGGGPNLGRSTTVHAGNGVFAFAKGLALCGRGFSITKGRCTGA